MIEIDASEGEGGGQVLRSSLTLSMLTGQAMHLTKIRGGRPKPGLMRQHLACVTGAQAICGARVEGAALGSTELRFEPGPLKAGHYRFEISTAGSCLLLLQTLWPALMQAQGASELELTGGTHNPMAPAFPFIEQSYAPLLARLGAPADLSLRRAGFYPAGGGQLKVSIPGQAQLDPFDLLEPGPLRDSGAACMAPALPRAVAERQLEALGAALAWPPEQLQVMPCRQNEGPGNALWIWQAHEHLNTVFCSISEKGEPGAAVARRTARALNQHLETGAALDVHLADQWLLPLALAVRQSGRAAAFTASAWSLHAQTNASLIERWLPLQIRTQPRERGGVRVDVSSL